MAAYNSEATRVEGLKARIRTYAGELELFRERGTNLNQVEPAIKDLERVQAAEEEYLKQVTTQTDVAEAEGAAAEYKGANISVIQSPSPPASDVKKSYKTVQGLAIGGVILGFGLAFLWELIFDRSLKRPKEVVARLKLPYFLTIPYMNGSSRVRWFRRNKQTKLKFLAANGDSSKTAAPENNALVPARGGPLPPWDKKHAMRPFHETLRDRLVAYFEMINLTHKPKLVAVTGCSQGAGVSTIATGLACSLSETGEGNVLLVDMNAGDGEAHHFYKGKPAMGLDEILEKEKANRQNALVQENLYVVKESNQDKLPSILPKRFSHLVTQLKASDYDYIILDMPPVTEISITPRLARFMDMILLVVESEKTGRDAAERAAALLSDARSNVGVVMNKTRTYVPKLLQHEL